MNNNPLLAAVFVAAIVVGNLSSAQELDLHIPKNSEFMEQGTIDLDEAEKSDPVARAYNETVKKKLERLQLIAAYPENQMGKRIYGTVGIFIVINANGTLQDTYPASAYTNDQKLLLGAAMKLVKSVGPFSPPPQKSAQEHKRAQLRLYFTYQRD